MVVVLRLKLSYCGITDKTHEAGLPSPNRFSTAVDLIRE